MGNTQDEETFHGRRHMDGHDHGPWHGGGKHGRHHPFDGREFHDHSRPGWGHPFDGRGMGRGKGRRGEWFDPEGPNPGPAPDADSTPDDPQDKP
ncbi:hypothetical protein D3C81_1912630 [compost metagenome]